MKTFSALSWLVVCALLAADANADEARLVRYPHYHPAGPCTDGGTDADSTREPSARAVRSHAECRTERK